MKKTKQEVTEVVYCLLKLLNIHQVYPFPEITIQSTQFQILFILEAVCMWSRYMRLCSRSENFCTMQISLGQNTQNFQDIQRNLMNTILNLL